MPVRRDLQGLRAVAVAAVVVNHLDPDWLPGGFAGVDVFFVLSGFLITGRLLRTAAEAAAGARRPLAYLGSFYLLRARRILPAALLVLAATAVAASLVFPESRAHRVDVDALWSAVFLANWHFAAAGTDYFQQGLAVSPVQHYWSLAVEEQFYLAWPLLVLLVAVLARRRLPRAVAALAGIVVVAGIAWSWPYSAAHPAVAYFSTFTRGWELAAGALLACLVPALRPRSAQVAAALSWIGLVVVGAALAVTPQTGFPVPWAIPAAAGACLVVLAGALGDTRRSVVLTNPVAGWIGDTSYSIYLWHFPAIIVLEALFGERGVLFHAAAVAATLGLATLSRHFVEEPARRWRWSLPQAWLPQTIASGLALLLAAALFVARPAEPAPVVAVAEAGPVASARPADPHVVEVTDEWRDMIVDALRLTDWPEIDFDGDGGAEDIGEAYQWPRGIVRDDGSLDLAVLPGDRDRVALLVGDSVMRAYYPMVRDALRPIGWTVVLMAAEQCPASFVPVLRGSAADGWQDDGQCDLLARSLPDLLSALRPGLVLASEEELTLVRMRDAGGDEYADPALAAAAHAQGLERTAALVEEAGARFVVLAPPPLAPFVGRCWSPASSPAACVGAPSETWLAQHDAELRAARVSGATYLDTRPYYCVQDHCPAVVKVAPIPNAYVQVKLDYTHLAPRFAEALGPQFRAALGSRGLLARP